ncbi:FAD synthetase family protein [Domibacillus tundrae]|uniref:FAD synthetase family protein n=1 Tax=Domibacillus tundrae TaxID=1587527 RepID=UPI000697AB4C|nr:FAD synthetase family protein [Domibacillus tundrae]
MKVHYLSYPLDLSAAYIPSAISIGYFDGVHLGHQEVIQTGIQVAKNKNLASAVMTFHPHPKEILGKGDYSSYITPLEDKLEILKNMDVDIAYIVQFNPALSKVKPHDFIEYFLAPLKIKHIVVGFDYKFGFKGTGTPEFLKLQSEKRYEVDVLEPVKRYEFKVGSTLIRDYLKKGKISFVNELLGRPYSFKAAIKENKKLRSAGLKINAQKSYLLPKEGTFQVNIYALGKFYTGLLVIKPDEKENLLLYLDDFYQINLNDRDIRDIRVEIQASVKGDQYHNQLKELSESPLII